MRMLSFVLMALVGTMILGFPLQSYADAQLDILLNIATQARDNLSITISQTNNVPDEINQLYKQGSEQTDELAKAVDQQDVESARQHFLAAMKFFKETNDKLNSLNATAPNDQQKAEITQLRGEIIRLVNMEILLKTIAARNNIDVNFAKFDELIQTAIQDLDGGNINDAKTAVKNANDFLVETHHVLAAAAKERISERAKNFTERQIERLSKMSELNPNPPQNIAPTIATPPPLNSSSVPTNTTGINTTSSTITPPPIPPSSNPSTAAPALNYSSMVTRQNPEEMLAELKKLVSEGKVDEALKAIKMIEAYQKEKLKEKAEQVSSTISPPNTAGNLTNSTSTTTTLPPIPPPLNSSSVPTNTTGINTTSSTITPPPSNPMPQIPSGVDVIISQGAGSGQNCVQERNCFSPSTLDVNPGKTVTWYNGDKVGHTVTSGNPSDNKTGTVWDSSLIKAGNTYSFTFQNAGTYNYFCMVHPWMTGVIIVGGGAPVITPPPHGDDENFHPEKIKHHGQHQDPNSGHD